LREHVTDKQKARKEKIDFPQLAQFFAAGLGGYNIFTTNRMPVIFDKKREINGLIKALVYLEAYQLSWCHFHPNLWKRGRFQGRWNLWRMTRRNVLNLSAVQGAQSHYRLAKYRLFLLSHPLSEGRNKQTV
jgi:hypothetical protein